MKWEQLQKTPEFLFRQSGASYPCEECNQSTEFIAFGIHKFNCSPECLREILERKVRDAGLKDFVRVAI